LKRFIAAGLLLVLPALSSCALVPQEETLPQMPLIQQIDEVVHETTQVVRGDLALEKIFSCSYQAAEEEKLYFSQKNQAIAAVYVQAGDKVEKGQLIAELDNTSILKSIENQQYTLDSLNLQIVQQQKYIETQQERIRVLTELAKTDPAYEARVTSAQQTLESRNSQLTLLYAQLSVERSTLAELEADLKARQLYAGISGTVSYTTELGSTTVYTKNQLICTIQNLGEASFVGFFKEGLVTAGQQLTLQAGTKEYPVEAVSVAEPDVNGNCSVRFALLTPDPSLKAGDSARVTMVSQFLPDVLYLPTSAVHSTSETSYVFYIDEKGLIAAKEVETGVSINGFVHIVAGLAEGESVLLNKP